MDQKQHKTNNQLDFYVLPLVGSAIAGFIIAGWIGVSGILGTLIGAFVIDAFRGLRGTNRFVKEAEHLVQQARNLREKQKGPRTVRDAPDAAGPSEPLQGEKCTNSDEQPPK